MTKKIVHESWRDFEQKDFSKSLKRILFISDVHSPYHCVKSWQLMLRAAYGFRPDMIVQMGDLCDFYAASRFDKNPLRLQKHRLIDEVNVTNGLLDDLDNLGATEKFFLCGNHEYRWDVMLQKSAPELVDFPGMSIKEIFRFKDRGWKYTPYKSHTRIGKLYLTHESGSCGPSAHITARNDFQSNVIQGHSHACGVSYRGNALGETHVGAVFGHMADLKYIDYAHAVKAKAWVKAFGVGYMENNGSVHISACPIIRGSVVVGGVLYK